MLDGTGYRHPSMMVAMQAEMQSVWVADVVLMHKHQELAREEGCRVGSQPRDVGLSEGTPWQQLLLPIGRDSMVRAVNKLVLLMARVG